MRFNYVSFRNFLSYGDELSTVNLNEGGITLVNGENKRDGGSNGSGKSSAVIDSVVYALFGQITKKLKADQIVNNRSKKDCYVELSFNINTDEYLIRRYRLHSEMSNSLILEKNGKDISGEGIRDTQRNIEQVIKMSFKSFVLSIVLSQEKISNFAESDPLERKKIVENLLMYDFLSRYHKASKEILRIINPKIRELIDKIKEREETINTLSTNLMSYIDKWESQFTSKTDRINELKVALGEWSNLNVEEELSKKRKIEQLKELVDTKSKAIKDTESIESDLKKKIKSYNSKLYKIHKEVHELNVNPEECPVCGSKIKEGTLKKYLQGKIDGANELRELINFDEIKAKEIRDSIKKDTIKLNGYIEKKNELVSSVNEELSIDDLNHISDKISEAEQEIRILENQLDIDIEKDPYIIDTQNKVNELRQKKKRLARKLKRLEEEKEYYEWWKLALSNSPNSIKTFCVNHVLQSLNKYISYYLEFFKFDVTYQLDNELNDVIEKDSQKASFAQLSAGEKRSIELSLIFALHEIVRLKMPDDINIIVLDELLSTNLDDVRITSGVDILSELANRDLSVFVIDHKNYLKDNLECKNLNIIKDKEGISRLETV